MHEKNIEIIKTLPEMYPWVQTFSLPYLHLMWRYRYSQEFRVRFSKNLPHVIAIGDAWSLGLTRGFIASEVFKRLRDPRRLAHLVGEGVKWNYANPAVGEFSRAFYLPQPIFRYYSLFPRTHLKKLEGHAKTLGIVSLYEKIDILKPYVDDPSTFWKKVMNISVWNYPERLRLVRTDEHPRIMQNLISDPSNALESYRVREEILNELRGL